MKRDVFSLAVCLRAGVAALVVLKGDQVYEVQQVLVRHACRDKDIERVTRTAGRLITDYSITNIVSDSSEPLHAALQECWPVELISIKTAKLMLMHRATTHAELFSFIVTRNPELRRFVTMLYGGQVATWDRRRTVVLLATALGLAREKIINQKITL